ncbi:MAG: T9SS type A sorting domain-containing protein [Crocinitomicaceae bacterium]
MKRTSLILTILLTVQLVFSQFTVIPTGINIPITGLEKSGDTLFIVSQDGYLAKTIDNGQTFTEVTSYGISGYANFEFQIRDGIYYYMATQGNPYEHNYIFKSEDYGDTWDMLYDTTGFFKSFHIVDSTFGAMGGTFGGYAMTVENDTSWALDTLAGTLTQSTSYGDSTLIFMSTLGFCLRTEDRGQSWNWGYSNSSVSKELEFINEDTIYSAHIEGPSKSHFCYSFDNGNNFNTVYLGHNSQTSQYEYTSQVYDFSFDDAAHGYMIGYMYDSLPQSGGYDIEQGVIFETSDYGQTWTPHLTGFSEEFYSFQRMNDSIYFIGGANGLLLKWNRNIPFSGTSGLAKDKATIEFDLYPNPASNKTTLQIDKRVLPVDLKIYNQSGQLLKSILIKMGNITVNLEEFPSGIYFLEVQGVQKKLIIQDD